MPAVPIHPPAKQQAASSPLPTLLSTPSGLAIIELQGNLNTPSRESPDTTGVRIGHLEFPDYDPAQPNNTAWQKKVYLYIGKHQRMTGEVKKLPQALAVLRKKAHATTNSTASGEMEQVEIVDIVRYKILFSNRPEPVGVMGP